MNKLKAIEDNETNIIKATSEWPIETTYANVIANPVENTK
jgi:hypothetical protein